MLTASRHLRDNSAANGDNGCVRSVRRAELLDDALHVVLHGVRLDDEAQRDLAVGQAVYQELEDLLLTSGQRRQQVYAGRGSTTRLTEELIHELFEPLILALQLVQHLNTVDQDGGLICEQLQQPHGVLIHARSAGLTAGVEYT